MDIVTYALCKKHTDDTTVPNTRTIAGLDLENDISVAELQSALNIEDGANKTVVDSSLSSSSTNPVQNKKVYEQVQNLQSQIDEIITPATEDAEVQNARVDANGVPHGTLKERLDSDYNQLNENLSYLDITVSRLCTEKLIDYIQALSKKTVDTTTGRLSPEDFNIRYTDTNINNYHKGDIIIVSSPYLIFYIVMYNENNDDVRRVVSAINNDTYTFDEDCRARVVYKRSDNADMVWSEFTGSAVILIPTEFNYSNKQIDNKILNFAETELSGLKWVVVGDSITDTTVHSPNKYHYWVSQDTGITISNFGKSETGFKRTEESGTAFYQRVALIPTDANIITIMGGGNDASQDYTLGNITDSTTATWCGCVNKTIDNIIQRCPYAQIAIVSPYPWQIYPTTTNNRLKEESELLKQIAEYRGFKFLDLFKHSGLRVTDTNFVNHYFENGDGVHLNETGHKTFLYPAFKQLVESMLGRLSNRN